MKRAVHTLEISVSKLISTAGYLMSDMPPHVEYFGLKGVLEKPSIGSAKVPSLIYCVFQLMFAAITYVAYSLRTSFPS